MVTEALLLLLVLLGLLGLVLNKRPKGIPPGEWGLPVIGKWPDSTDTIENQAIKYKNKYGDIFTWRIGSRTMIFLNNYKLIREAFNNPSLNDRPDMFTLDLFTYFQKIGLANSNGDLWHINRRFALRQLKDLGMGRSTLMDAIQDEAAYLVEDFKKHTGTPQHIPRSLPVAVLNVIWKMTADIRYEVEDPKVHAFHKIVTDAFEASQGSVYDMLPWLLYVSPPFLRRRFGVYNMLEKFDAIRKYIKSVIEEHERTYNPDSLRDYIDIYLHEMKAKSNDPNSTMSKLDLCIQLGDLFTAGSETTSQTLSWAILYMTKYPHIQERCQREIDAAVDRHTLPGLEHKAKLPYLEAVISEVSRISTLVPLGIMHCATEDTYLGGYRIPKGAIIVPHQEHCHRDPAHWEHPDKFYPEHFLDQDGKCINKKDSYLPFSVGKRLCPGEGLAKMEMFLFFSALLQNFTFSVPNGQDVKLDKDPDNVVFNFPKMMDILITNRP